MERRTLDANVCAGAVGLGWSGMSGADGHSADEQSIATLHGALNAGMTFTGTADHQGMGHRGATVAQLAIAWVLAQGRVHRDIVALVGAGRPRRSAETASAAGLRLTQDDLDVIEQAVPRGAVAGERHAPALLALLDSERTGSRH
ncbi:hypothetical protein AB0C21_28360 [Spirillospora sp. NPDC049024]